MRILVLHDTPHDFESWLVARFPQHEFEWAKSPGEVETRLQSLEPEVVFSIKHSQFPGDAHRPALHYPSVRWFQVGGSGYEHLGKWDRDKVTVTNSSGVLAPFHAERAMAGLLALSTGLLKSRSYQARSEWIPDRFCTLQGRTLLIVGLGQTGRELAARAAAFGMKILAVKRTPVKHPPVDEVHPVDALVHLWERADVVSLNVPHNEETHRLVDADVFRKLRPHTILLNGSRGAVVEEAALVAALEANRLGGAWLDVFEHEPLAVESPLWQMENVIVTPHSADQVVDFPFRFAQFFAENLERYAQGDELVNVVW
ncbi:MAG: D-2-hydroxyacid dehydrogenase [Candidatus Eremiobacteraeota bacterium]|nr:D-2-hydroxyacid dehydrogenase [Candidatus Eremiobacteraeota bacterium]